ncbi:MAG TPA: glutathione S-transferase [Ferrovibrio sp.]|uniref:glutathione S-transferase family protein n=1 Tax=Ferrovibrio sp. TaxID=1917215 RepID=UPI002B4AD282|nr:glutathione S-transferase [Ferrovibrio sp.]HLT77484.1 glutathione S-transferase [Ferrovibrio sp.]
MNHPPQPIRLYRHALSGHAHRVQLMLSLLNLPVELVEVDLAKGEHKSPDFLRRNPFGEVPVIEDGDVTLADSNAILVYLASRYDASRRWYPDEPVAAASVQQWLSVAAGQLAFGPAMARVIHLFRRKADTTFCNAIAAKLFGVMEARLSEQNFLAAGHPTIADVALYSYTAHAPEGALSLEPYPAIRTWLTRIEAQPGFVAMPRSPLPEAA